MSKEEKKAIEKLKEYALCKVDDNGYVEVSANGYKYTILNLIENQQKELNNLKEIEKSHKEENEKLRIELEQYKLLEANIVKANKIIAENKFDEGLDGLLMKEKEKNKELEEKLKIAKQLYNDACVCIATDCVEKDKIKDMMKYREFELQQEYKEFEEDVEWRTYKKILEDK